MRRAIGAIDTTARQSSAMILLASVCLALSACGTRDAAPVASTDAAAAQRTAAATAAWGAIGRWPDFQGGIWLPQRGPRSADEQPSYVPEVAARLAKIGPIRPETLGNAYCLPAGGPSEEMGEIFFSKNIVFIIKDEDFLLVRQVHLDQTGHGDPDPSYLGHSIGHWDGDTLVIDTVALLPEVTVAPKVPGNGKTHLIERLRLIDADTLEQTVTTENPEVLTQPWTRKTLYKIRRDLHVKEAFCAQNNRDMPVDGETHTDLNPPPRGY